MDKGLGNDSTTSISSSSSSSSATIPNREMLLKHVNRNSLKIAKPIRRPLLPPTAAASSALPIPNPNPHNPAHPQPPSQQPPVYNINKNDFRDVVQKLTGSPAHERMPTPPPPVTNPSQPSSRLQRIRPPPLPQICNRPELILPPQNDAVQRFPALPQVQPFQPLPPLPSVHAAAESPISAHMRFLQNSHSSSAPSNLWNRVAPIGFRPDSLTQQNEFVQRAPFSQLMQPGSPISANMLFFQGSGYSSSAALPRGISVALPPPTQPQPQLPLAAPQQQQQQQPLPPSSAASPSPYPALPLSPLPFGCVPSPRSPYGMASPGFLLSPTGQLGLPQLPLSPTLPVPSPRWKST